ncbi:MAG: helix-hairpin-helix domain-containing protein [Acidobacteriaceae bacterium]|nr:helix-hairpin-helix domain-containing protein [Acidobacteriaceae bacterium]
MKRLQRWSLPLGLACLLAFTAGLNAQAPAPAKDTAKKAGKSAPTAPVDINNASAAELQSVPGIGAATAKKIIAARPYTSVSDLSKAGLPASQIKTIAPMLKVGPASAAASTPAATSAASSAGNTASKPSTTASKTATTAAGSASCASDMVWVNTETKVYHKAGDKYFANTKHGKCMSEADAQKAGYHLSGQKTKQ